MNRHANGRRGLIGRVKTAGATICGKCCPYGNPLQSQRVPIAPWKPSAPTLSTDTTAELLTNHQPGGGSLLLDRGGLILRYRSDRASPTARTVSSRRPRKARAKARQCSCRCATLRTRRAVNAIRSSVTRARRLATETRGSTRRSLLKPVNADFDTIFLTGADEEQLHVVAEVVEVLGVGT